MTNSSSRIHLADPLPLSEVPNFHFVSSTEEHVESLVKVKTIDETVSVKRGQKLAFLQRNPVDLIGRGTHTQVRIYGVENHVSWKMGNSSPVMCTILGVELDTAVDLGHGDFAVVVSEDIELDDFAVEAS